MSVKHKMSLFGIALSGYEQLREIPTSLLGKTLSVSGNHLSVIKRGLGLFNANQLKTLFYQLGVNGSERKYLEILYVASILDTLIRTLPQNTEICQVLKQALSELSELRKQIPPQKVDGGFFGSWAFLTYAKTDSENKNLL